MSSTQEEKQDAMPANQPPTPDERDRAAELSQVEVNILNELWDNFTPEEYDAMIRAQELSTQAAYNTGLSDGRAAARAEGRVKGLEEAARLTCLECLRGVPVRRISALGGYEHSNYVERLGFSVETPCVASPVRATIDAAREGGEGQ